MMNIGTAITMIMASSVISTIICIIIVVIVIVMCRSTGIGSVVVLAHRDWGSRKTRRVQCRAPWQGMLCFAYAQTRFPPPNLNPRLCQDQVLLSTRILTPFFFGVAQGTSQARMAANLRLFPGTGKMIVSKVLLNWNGLCPTTPSTT